MVITHVYNEKKDALHKLFQPTSILDLVLENEQLRKDVGKLTEEISILRTANRLLKEDS